MKLIVRILSITILLMGMGSILYLLYFINAANYNSKIPVETDCQHLATPFNFESEIDTLNLSEIKKSFPYDTYLELGNYCNAEAIKNSLVKLNKINPGQENVNRGILITAFTDKLQTKIADRFETFNPDSLIIILQWIDEFKTYEKVSTDNAALFGIVYEHWMGFISNQLTKHYEQQPSIRFDFKFKYLQSTCQSKRFAPAVGMSKTEKVVEYTLNKEYTYLFNRFWNGTNLLVKIVLAALICIFIYLLYCCFQYNFKK